MTDTELLDWLEAVATDGALHRLVEVGLTEDDAVFCEVSHYQPSDVPEHVPYGGYWCGLKYEAPTVREALTGAWARWSAGEWGVK